jgi:hypothetical protein
MVQVAWAASHGITDTTPEVSRLWVGVELRWIPTRSQADRSSLEFLADNQHGIKDDDGQRNDWVEL